jgi:hypothetical protein
MGDRMSAPYSASRADPSEVSEAASSALLLALTTEHFTLQTGRAATIAESNGRVSLFLGAVSSSVVAIALVGQLSGFGERFFVFALTLLPALIFLGAATYVRAIQNGIEDFQYARAINRIRGWYLQLHPDAPSLFMMSTEETPDGVMHGVRHRSWQALFTIAGVVAFVMSILVGVTASLISAGFGAHTYAAAAIGLGAGASAEIALYKHHTGKWREATGS